MFWCFFRQASVSGPDDSYILAGDEVVVSKAGLHHGLDVSFGLAEPGNSGPGFFTWRWSASNSAARFSGGHRAGPCA